MTLVIIVQLILIKKKFEFLKPCNLVQRDLKHLNEHPVSMTCFTVVGAEFMTLFPKLTLRYGSFFFVYLFLYLLFYFFRLSFQKHCPLFEKCYISLM